MIVCKNLKRNRFIITKIQKPTDIIEIYAKNTLGIKSQSTFHIPNKEHINIINGKLFLHHLPENAQGYITRDYKSELQEHVQKLTGLPSTYELVDETGPDHQKEFTMAVFVRDKEYGRGSGASKKLASQLAAENALVRIQQDPSLLEGG